MRILVISPPAFTRHAGATQKEIITNIELIKEMGHEVSLFSISTGFSFENEKVLLERKRLGINIQIFKPNLKSYLKRIYWILFKHPTFFDGASYVFGQLVEDPIFKKYVEEWNPDCILSHFCFSWPVMRFAKERGIPSIFRSHNYEATFFLEDLQFYELFYPWTWLRFLAKSWEEKAAVRYSNATAALPYKDVARYRKWKPENIFILTLSFPYKTFRSEPFVHKDKPFPLDIFYLGASYNISFHLQGAKALIEEIAPEVIKKAPGKFKFHICGGKLPWYLQEKCDGANIIYEDYVDDFEEFMSRMDFAAFPTYTGTTIKGKVCETMARAFPMVIPRNCLGTYKLESGKEVLLAETSPEFVEAILKLENEHTRFVLSQGINKFASEHFSKQALTSLMEEIFEAACKGAHS